MANFRAEPAENFFEKQAFASQLLEGKSPQEIWNLSAERMDKIYEFACDLYDQKRYHDASDVFLLLTTLNPQEPSYWKGFGFASQQIKDFAAAATAYETALSIDSSDAKLYPCYVRTLCEMHQFEEAKTVLKECLNGSPEVLAECQRIVKGV